MHIKFIFRCALIILVLLQAAYAAENLTSTNKLLQKTLDEAREKYQFGAMALTVIAPAISPTPMHFISGSQKRGGRALRTSDYFQIGSNTKSFTAALLIKLQSDGFLSLQDSLTKWLPQYPQWKQVQIQNLLKNNTGIQDYPLMKTFLEAEKKDPYRQFTPEELVAYASKKPLLFKPGQGWDYSNTNWILAGMIAEKATGKSISALFNHYFLGKNRLDLSDTLYWSAQYNKAILSRMVHGYDDKGQDITSRNASWAGTAGAIIATNDNLAHWVYALFHGKALSRNELTSMQELVSVKTGKPLSNKVEQKMEDPLGYGMGIAKRYTEGVIWWGHEGHTLGYHSLFAFFPAKDITLVIQANGLKNADFKPVMMQVIHILDNAQSSD